ncbi:hypothetical protein [Methylocella sp.]|uniref:hypothetical protein n=1 Tax=Methylocella sp. TaxID=1978226 RepID=UPI003783DF68
MSENTQEAKKPTFKARALEELRRFAEIFLYVWVILSLFALHKFMLLPNTRLGLDLGFALLNALILSKIILIGEDLRFDQKFEDAAPFYAVLYRSGLFAILLIALSILEDAVPALWRGESFMSAVKHLGDGRVGGVVIAALILFVALIPFFSFKEIAAAMGPQKLRRTLFEPRTKKVSPAG